MVSVETLILGAGLSGLSAAYHLGTGYHLLEKSDRPGGLCKTDVYREAQGAFYFDATGHWLHLRDPEIKSLVDLLLPDRFTSIERRARIYSNGMFTRYPYQVNTFGLPPAVVSELLLGFHEALYGPEGKALREREPENFAEFIQRYLGEGFAKHFMFPYNTKLYTVHPRELSAAWCGRFVPRPNLKQVIEGALGIGSDQLGYNAHFIYPREGGIETLPRGFVPPVEKKGPLDLGVTPVALDWRKRELRTSDGRIFTYRTLVSSIPPRALVDLMRAGGDVPAAVEAASQKLRAVWTTYVNVGARGDTQDHHWIYFPEAQFPFYRVGIPSSTYRALAPAGTCSFYVEFSREGEAWPHADAEAAAVAGLVQCGLLARSDDVIFARARTIPNSYVLYDREYGAARKTLVDFLESAAILPVGRYGNWEYSSMEDAILGGRAAARRIEARRAA
jgi:protoporphyrinogen oxidase